MPPEQALSFGPYRLAGPHGPLWCDTQVVPVPPKALAVLWRLVTQAGQVVTKEALLDAGWAGTVVSEGVLAACLHTLRQALGEDAQQPRYIATVHRLGYRFVAPVTATEPGSPAGTPMSLAAPPISLAPARPPLVVGRAAELAQVHAWFDRARQGGRQLIFVTGEAGIGKTTLVEAFLAEVAAAQTAWIGRGQCIEQHGGGEAYLPLLEALGRLGWGPDGARLVACLRRYAPTWLAQLPAVVGEAARAGMERQGPGVTPQRMLRELAEALEALTAEQPLIVVLEDLHWSDASTVEALALLARRREAARLMVLGTYRPVELILRQHPLKAVKQELALHGHCAELPVGYLTRAEVQAYLAQQGASEAATAELAAWVHRRTEGHPLFMVHVVQELARRGRPTLPTAAEVAGRPAEADAEVPAGLEPLIELQLGHLGAEAQQVLEVASVVGAEFAEASVAAGVSLPLDAIAAICEGLARQGQFLEDLGLAEWPDGTVSGRFGFRHALYREVLYRRLGSGRRVRVHRTIGARLETAYGAQASQLAAALAVHFERGGDPMRAVRYRQQAATTAMQRSTYPEAFRHLTQGLALLQTLPDTPERRQLELDLLLDLGPILIVTKGWTSPDIERTYGRARDLCRQLGDTPQLFPALFGLWLPALARSEMQAARALAEELLTLAQRLRDPALLLEAHWALGITVLYLGEFAAVREHMAQGMALYEPQQHHALALLYTGTDVGVNCRLYAAWALWYLGYPAQALHGNQEALALAQELAHPFSHAFALHFAARLHQCRQEGPAVQKQAEASVTLCTGHGFALYAALGTLLQGWGLIAQGQGAEGLAQMRQGLTDYRAMGGVLTQTYWLALLAEAYGRGGQVGAGLTTVSEALAAVDTSGERFYEAELYRLKGELTLQAQAQSLKSRVRRKRTHTAQRATPPGPDPQAEACFQQALGVARQQQAKALELRAAMSLSQLWQQQGKKAHARRLLAEVYGWFTEGFDTADLQEAQALLEELA